MKVSRRSSEAFWGGASAIDTKPHSLGARLALGLIAAYKVLLSPLFTGNCRFVPSCASYSSEAISRFGLLRGGWLGAKRLCRCHPLGGHGFDPVPND
jgi:putative membrane protein insertion efficiency factor